MRRPAFVAACLGMLAFGIVLTTLGAALPSIIPRFGIDTSAAGALFLLMTFGILTATIIVGPVADAKGFKALLVVACVLIAAGLVILALAPSLAWIRVAVSAIGFGGGFVNAGANALAADLSADEGRSSGLAFLGVFFGVGAVGVPFALAMLLDRFSYSAILAGIGALVFLIVLVMSAMRFPPPKQPQGFPLTEARRILRDPVLLLMGLMLFLESGMEIGVGGWTATFFKADLQLSDDRALFLLSLYWVGMMLTRLVSTALLRRVSGLVALYICLAAGFSGALLVVSAHGAVLAGIGVFLIGCGLALTFPVILGLVADRYAELSATAISVAIVMALVGGMFVPFAMGVIGAQYGLRSGFLLVPASLVLLASLLALYGHARLTVARQH